MKEPFGLYLILSNPVAGYETCTRAAVDAGVRYLQLRMKDASRTDMLETARKLRGLTRASDTRFIVNDHLDIAMETDADGLHLGQEDLSLSEARTLWNTPGKIFGLSTHSLEQARKALELEPDYIGVGPVFPTRTKTDAEPVLGAGKTGEIVRNTPLPCVAIGGIHAENLPELLEAGVANFCVVSAVNDSPDPAAAIRQLQEIHRRCSF